MRACCPPFARFRASFLAGLPLVAALLSPGLTAGAEEFPSPVQFSAASGVFTNPFVLTLTSADSNAVVLFTLDGESPGGSNSFIYDAPITVSNTTRLRAVALVSNQTSQIAGAGYIKLAGDLTMYTSSLPIMVVETFGGGTIPPSNFDKQPARRAATWTIFDRLEGASAFTNPPQMVSDIGIRGRGASSAGWAQEAYSVEAITETGEERKVSPLGIPAHADWVLYYPDAIGFVRDFTMLYNTFAYALDRAVGREGVRFRWVEAFVNEDGGDLQLADRRGVYAIVEKVSRGDDRLDFERLSTDGATGSWLLKIDRRDPEPDTGWPAPNGATNALSFRTPHAVPLTGMNFDNPNGYVINATQRLVIQTWFTNFENVLWDPVLWRHPTEGYRKYIDVANFAGFFAINTLTRNADGLALGLSMFPWKGADGKLRMGPCWDFNRNSYSESGPPDTILLWHPEALWYGRLFSDPDFFQLYVDHWWGMRMGGMSDASIDAIIDGQAAEITPAKAALNGAPDFNSRVLQMKTWLKARANWIDSQFLRPPVFNQSGGDVPDGFEVTISGTNGTLYFTTDGSDPRAPGGTVAASAQAYGLPFRIFGQTFIQARVRSGTNWSGLASALFRTPQDLSRLAITEIMYHPPTLGGIDGEELEFLELKNTGTNTLQIGGLSFTGIVFAFTNGTLLGPGEFLLLARNPAALAVKYPGIAVHGVYSGKLDNAGETIRLAAPPNNTVLAITYNDRAPWPIAPDGHGFSLVPRNTFAPENSDNGTRWRASSLPGGSPGADDPSPSLPAIVINEILTHTDLPLVDAIELFNPTTLDADIGGWFLSDDGVAPRKFRIPDGTLLPAGGHIVFTEFDFNPVPATPLAFSFDSTGESIYLSSGDAMTNLTGYSHGIDLGAAPTGVSFGRYVNSVGDEQFPLQLAATFHTTNAGPVIGPVVLSEIMYHPDADGDEFIELRNITPADVPLFDPTYPTNTWRMNGLSFTLPTNVVVPSNGLVLLVATNPAFFRMKYAVPDDVAILRPYAGTLQETGERLQLQRPDEPTTNGLAYVAIDEVRYNDKAPWPPGADGGGLSLQRRLASAYGNDPQNWEAAIATPGHDFVPGPAPVITVHPQGRSITAFDNVIFSVSVTGAPPLFFQWFFNGTTIPGATNATLALTNVPLAQAGRHEVLVFNEHGSAMSIGAQLYVFPPLTIFQQPQYFGTNVGGTATFSVGVTGDGFLRHQWRFNDINISGATNVSLTLTNVQVSDEGLYSVVVSGSVNSLTSAPARLFIHFVPFIIQQPVSQSVPTGGTVTLSVVVTNNATLPLGYRLRRNGVILPESYVSVNERSAFFTITNVRAPFTNYAIIVTNAARVAGIPSTPVVIRLLADSDGDGLPDDWEAQFGFATNDTADASIDSDEDGMLNWEEWVAGTDPTNAASYLQMAMPTTDLSTTVKFGAIAARTYTVEFAATPAGPWLALTNIPARATNHSAQIVDPAPGTNRFYRVITPHLP